ncbi:MAG: sugar phosphate isomerase/epimerase [Clostridia bacterium]|nr:sugar phosphate isomerase/epimerase [Clostridia bacterium]
MEIGVSTATLFKRKFNEDALQVLNEIDARVCEIFLCTYQEYTPKFAKLLKERKGNLTVHSIHTLNTHFEPQLFGASPRAVEDAYEIMKNCLNTAKLLGAKNYTLHGIARFKRNAKYNNYEDIGKKMQKLVDFCNNFGVALCLENVEWAYYNHVGFYDKIKPYCNGLKTCLDIKQARVSTYSYVDYINEMKDSINTVHLSDVDNLGKICLPGKGSFDFKDLFKRLKDYNFNGNMLIETYYEDYNEIEEIKESLYYLRNLKEIVF